MPYIGNPIYQSAFVTDQFSGTGSQTAYTMSVAPAGTSNVLVVVSGVVQDPSTYGVVGNTLTFSAAPPSGTGNISCRYLGVPVTGVTTTAYRTVTEFTATAGQTTFTPPSYNVGFINVYLKGVLLGSADYTATNGTTVVLATGASAGNILTVESFNISSVANAIANAAGSVGTSNIATGAVTAAKMAASSVVLTSPTVTGVLPIANGGTGGTNGVTGFKNRIINGAQVINQRAATVTNPNPSYITDRWNAVAYGACTVGQSSTAPTGFTNSIVWTTTTGSSPSASQWGVINQGIEGYNVADLGWGASSAQTITLSFWVRASATGTYSIGIGNPTTVSNLPGTQTRSYVSTYTINAANTWEQKTITIAGDTSGTWLTTNGVGICVTFDCGSGSNYQTSTLNAWQAGAYWRATGSVGVGATTSATLYITGVQFEVGTAATNFDFRSYPTELIMCQRYCEIQGNVSSFYVSPGAGYASLYRAYIPYKVTKRTSATVTTYGTSGYPNNAGKIDVDGVGDASVTAQAYDTCGFRISGMPSPYSGQGGYKAEAEL